MIKVYKKGKLYLTYKNLSIGKIEHYRYVCKEILGKIPLFKKPESVDDEYLYTCSRFGYNLQSY